jgi:hypothetical protein
MNREHAEPFRPNAYLAHHEFHRERRREMGERIALFSKPFTNRYVAYGNEDVESLRHFAGKLKETVDRLVEILGETA